MSHDLDDEELKATRKMNGADRRSMENSKKENYFWIGGNCRWVKPIKAMN